MVFRKLFKDKKFKFFLISSIIYRFLLDLVFVFCISKEYYYWNYNSSFSIWSSIFSWLVFVPFIILVYITLKNKNGILPSFMFVLFLFSIVPFSSLIMFNHFSSQFVLFSLLYFAFLFFLLFFLARKTLISGKTIEDSKMIKILLLVLSAIIFYIWGHYSGFRFYLGLSKSEILREDATNYSYSTLFDYAFSWAQLLVPLFLCVFIGKNKWFWSAICVVDILLIYFINGMKLIFLLAFVIVFLRFLKKSKKNTYILVLNLFSFACLIGLVEYRFLKTNIVSGTIIMRMMYMPNSLSYYYFDFFSSRVPDFYRASFLSHLGFVTPYPDLPLTIAKEYYNSEMFCNNGLMSEAFANMGYLGIFVHPILIIVILKMLDSKIGNYDTITFLCVGFVLALRFISSYVITALFTYGLLVVILLIKPKIQKCFSFLRNGKKISKVDFDCINSRNCR